MVSAAYDRAQLWRDNEPLIVKLQAFCRMFIARKAYKGRKDFIANQVCRKNLIRTCSVYIGLWLVCIFSIGSAVSYRAVLYTRVRFIQGLEKLVLGTVHG